MNKGYAYCCCICKEWTTGAEGGAALKPLLSTKCGHLIHQQCLQEFFIEYAAWSTKFCPECRAELTIPTDIVRIFPTIVDFPSTPSVTSLNKRIKDLTAQIEELSKRLEVAFQNARDSEKALAQYKAEVESVNAQLKERNKQYKELIIRTNQSYSLQNWTYPDGYPVNFRSQEQMFNPRVRPPQFFPTQFRPLMHPPPMPMVNFGPFPGPLMGMAPLRSGPLQQRFPIRPTPVYYNKRSVTSTNGGMQNVPLPKLSKTAERTDPTVTGTSVTPAAEDNLAESMKNCSLETSKKPIKTGKGEAINNLNGKTTVKDEEKILNVPLTVQNDEKPNQTTLGPQRTVKYFCPKCSLSWTSTLGGDNQPKPDFCHGCKQIIFPFPI